VGVSGEALALSEVSGLGVSCRIRSSFFSEKEKKEENKL